MTFFHTLTLSLLTCTAAQFFEKLEIVSDLKPESCFKKTLNYIEAADDGLPRCTNQWDDKNDLCNKYFNPNYKPCARTPPNMEKTIIYKPTSCTKEGNFGPVQCKGERTTGRCFCFDDKGYRLFGQQWWVQADNMTCACSRKKAEMADATSPNYVFFNSLHCNSMGNYEGLQCDILSEQCWCADEKTGNPASMVVPMTALAKLPCYESMTIGTQYLRQCENKLFAQRYIQNQLRLRGTTASFGTFLCDDDGAYGAFAIIENQGFCTWRDNSKLGSFASGNPDPAVQNCNAAKNHLLTCLSNGNYQTYQGTGSDTYCVDPDGFRKSKYNVTFGDKPDEACAVYTSYVEDKCP